MPEDIFDLIVIGAGPGGYTAAIRASQLGMSVAVVEKRDTLGGVCLNEGCIPSKALLDSSELFTLAKSGFGRHGIVIEGPRLDLAAMMARKNEVVKKLTDGISFLFRKNKIRMFLGEGRPAGARRDGLHVVSVSTSDAPAIPQLINGRRVLLAAGGRPAELPALPFDGVTVVSSRETLSFDSVPEKLVVIGGGSIGLELGSVWNRLGAQVTVVESLPALFPNGDRQVYDALMKSLAKQGMRFLLQASVTGGEVSGGKAVVRVTAEGTEQELACDKVLVAIGRVPDTSALGLQEAGVRVEENGRIEVDDDYMTSARGIYAVGDLVHGPLLAHKAMEEGVVFAERLTGQASLVEYEFIPSVTYTYPEAASVGRTEEQLREAGIRYSVGRFPFSANGRARCLGDTDGFAKILAQSGSGKVLGVHVVGPRASELITEAVTVMSYGGGIEDIAMTFHAHPTLSEAMKEAALDAAERAIHA